MSSERETPSLASPPEDLDGFPGRQLETDEDLCRVVRRGRGAWWFGSSGKGRFDLEPPEGTCYLARDEIAALLEKLGGRTGGGVSEDYFSSLRLVKLRVPIAHSLADLTSRRASGFGVTSEVGTIVPYNRPRAWAAGLRSAGFDGLAYGLRHDPSASEGVALFGPEGERSEWPPGDESGIEEHLLRRLQVESGLKVLPRPRLSDLRVERPEVG